jgi:kynureninase
MNYQNSLAFAIEQDEKDPLKDFRNRFLIPKHNGRMLFTFAVIHWAYSQSLQPNILADQMNNWQNLAVEGWFQGMIPGWSTINSFLNPLPT